MIEDVDEVELFEHGGYVCAVRTMKSKHTKAEPWHQGVVYLKDGVYRRSNWYTKPEDAVKMARVMVNQEKNGAYR